jgi:hypothetical protein
MIRALLIFSVLTFSTVSVAKMTTKPATEKVQVTNMDKKWVWLKDDKGVQYKYPRDRFMVKDFKVHKSYPVALAELQAYKISKKKPKTKKTK